MNKLRLRLSLSVVVVSAAAPLCAATIFPQPMHIVRRVEDPIARTQTTLHEYCAGNRVVSVNGDRVAIADYDRQQLTEIDRTAGTYSITRFDEIAKATEAQRNYGGAGRVSASRVRAEKDEWTATPLGVKTSRSGRAVESYEFRRGEGEAKRSVEVGIDRRFTLSRHAVEVLVGAAYPNDRTPEQEVVLRAAGGMRAGVRGDDAGSTQEASYALPAEHAMTYEIAGQTITVSNSIVSVTSEAPPDDVMQIPPGAKQVESRITRLARELRELDELPGAVRK